MHNKRQQLYHQKSLQPVTKRTCFTPQKTAAPFGSGGFVFKPVATG
ncbi:hypothetical protein SAMCFNEI73_Ch3145 [Sinorhizobium americanum]|uniref:Uncharacterized protein n=1 Tax=Sinorhizobium americanum TaxID=194963 RepID=A0A1L3LQQ3_9HYPH|nr:hypothetical protein SAMCFNEI73_Ch3145 [Sinorhizobium americanum]